VNDTPPNELTLSQIWNAQWLAPDLTLVDGRPVRVVYRGVWTHGLGPDFANAYLDIDGRLASGSVEIHRRASDWNAHGHDRDPAYDNVVLHVVWQDDLGVPVRRSNGRSVATLFLPNALPDDIEAFARNAMLRPLGAIGFDFCAPVAAELRPENVHKIWERAGDERMRRKTDEIAARLAIEPPAQALYTLLLDALGYSRNRDGMRKVAERLPYDHLDARLLGVPKAVRFQRAAGLLLGVGGFLPLSPHEQEIAGIETEERDEMERTWERMGGAWRSITVDASGWDLARVRPAAHPIRRLLANAAILARIERGLVEDLCARIDQADAYPVLRRWLTEANPYLGEAHAHEMIVNVVVPFGLAYGDSVEQAALVDRSMELWSLMPAGRGNSVVKRMVDQICGAHPVGVATARAEQGLLHLHRTGCSVMRCFECPIAQLELMSTQASPPGESLARTGDSGYP
jgi:hypothetical protein